MLKSFLVSVLLLHSLSVYAQTKATNSFFKAILKNDLILAYNAIKAGADVNGMDSLKRPTMTVLFMAIELKRYHMVKLLLVQNADVNQRRPSDFYSGLMTAAEQNDIKLAELFLSHGVDLNLSTVEGNSALDLAAKNNSVDVAKLLLHSKDVDVNAGGDNCALALAANNGHVGMSLLLKKQIGSKASNPICVEKALKLAKKFDHEEIVRILKRN